MAVVASFTADVIAGSSPLTVNFTDESTGSPTNWFWDFGDGTVGSSAQHPTHIYTVDGAYNVTLTAWVETGSATRSSTVLSSQSKSSANPSESISWTSFLAASFVSDGSPNKSTFRVEYFSFNVRYKATKAIFRLDLSSDSGKIIILQYRSRFFDYLGGPGCNVNGPWILSNSVPGIPYQDVTGLPDGTRNICLISEYGGGNFDCEISDGFNYTQRMGFGCNFPNAGRMSEIVGMDGVRASVRTYSSQATEIKENFIVVGPPIADFSGAPLSGSSPLSVNFSDLSLGPVTSWSWRKRKAGTNDAFVEFASSQTPSHNFDKTNP